MELTTMKKKTLAKILDVKQLSVDQTTPFSYAEAFLRLPTRSDELVGWMLDGKSDTHSRLPNLAEVAVLGFDTGSLAELGLDPNCPVLLSDILTAVDGQDFERLIELILKFNGLMQSINEVLKLLRAMGVKPSIFENGLSL